MRYHKRGSELVWVSEHRRMTQKYEFDRVPLPEKGEHVVRHGRKATGQSWALIAGLPKDRNCKGQRIRQDISGSRT